MAPRRIVSWFAATAAAWLVLHELRVLVPGLDGLGGPIFGRWVHVAVMAAGGLAVLARAVMHRSERLGWSLIAGALFAWTAGEAYFTAVLWDLASPPVPSPADAGYLLFPLLSLAGIVALARARLRRADPMMAADAATAALAAGAVSAALVFGPVLELVGGEPLAVATNLAYPVCDLLLLAAIVGIGALRGWRVGRTWVLLAAGCLTFTVTDGVYLVQVAQGSWISGGIWDAGWWAAAPAWALAAWTPAVRARPAHAEDATHARYFLPRAFATVALGVLVASAVWEVNALAIGLAAAALVASIARLDLTLRAHASNLRHAQGEALTDPLTGLGNRRRLASDLDERLCALDDDGGLMLVVFDLDGFKHYNDVFGHPAGDAVLVRLASRLRAAVGAGGAAYRLGGDEFCALLAPGFGGWSQRLQACVDALCEEGVGYAIGCSHGAILLPEDAADAVDAMRLADQRMYADKQDGRLSAVRQATDVLRGVLEEAAGGHLAAVPELAVATAVELGMNREEAEEVRRAAELHDVGKLAVPDAILDKPGPLDPEEWLQIRRHPAAGERIVAAAPALGRVARIIRSTHERHAGGGYPDGLAGEEIPLGARIVAVCDAFAAMTRTRPHRAAIDPEFALAELQSCAGEQFDPTVVGAFVRAWRASTVPAGSVARAAAA